MRMSLLALVCAALLLAACTSNGGDDSPGTPEGNATAVTTATAAATAAGGDATASDAPIDDGDAPVLVQRFIGNTGGSGVAVRDACAQDARAGGAWPQASGVLVLEVGTGGCDGWSYVARDGSSDESWVRNAYLVTERPAAVVSRLPTTTPTSPPATSTSTAPTPAPTQAPITYPQISISPNPLSFGEIPPGQTSTRSILLSNTSTDPVTITSVVFANGAHVSAAFEVTSNCDGQTVAAGVTCRFVARFTPQTGGEHSATLVISSSSATAPLTALVIGTGYIPE